VDAETYVRLHQELLRHCRLLAAEAGTGKKDYYHEVESLVQPWLTVEVLARADPELLQDLLRRCDQIDQCRGGWIRLMPSAGFVRWLAVLGAIALGVFLSIWIEDRVVLSISASVRNGLMTLWLAAGKLSDLEWACAGGLAVVIFSIGLAARTMRT
jgi:hypothetical protein